MKAVKEFFKFGMVGIVGFLVDTAVLYLLRQSIGLYWGRLGSFLAAVLATWVLNRCWTFRGRYSAMPKRQEFVVYLLLMMLGGIINYTVYALLVGASRSVATHPVIGVAAGSLSGMVINLLTSRLFLFKHKAL